MTRFEKCLMFILEREGGYVNDPLDRGGATHSGITQKTYDRYRVLHNLQPQEVEFIQHSEVKDIYFNQYWKPACCSMMLEPLDLVQLDSAVQHGPMTANKFLQQALQCDEVDGMIGPKTMHDLGEDIAAGNIDQLVEAYLSIRDAYYARIIERDPSQRRFEKGWKNRMASLRREIGAPHV